jgi:hypothetical protein
MKKIYLMNKQTNFQLSIRQNEAMASKKPRFDCQICRMQVGLEM